MKFAPRFGVILLASFLRLSAYHLAEPNWGLQADFPGEPKADDFRQSTERGEELTRRFYLEQGSLRFMVARFTYPVVPNPRGQEKLYIRSIEQMMNSRRGELKVDEPFQLGLYNGHRIVIAHSREKSLREVRQVLIGASLYVISAEWPAPRSKSLAPTPEAEAFFRSIVIPGDFADPRRAEELERWRELGAGKFHLRYDASAWYRDPTDTDPQVFNLLRLDEGAEAQLSIDGKSLGAESIEKHVVAVAKETADDVVVRKRGKKLRGSETVDDLEFAVKTSDATYINHGYFYSGPQGFVQLRGWQVEKEYPSAAADITELLDGLTIGK